jgi:hypothetical protein
MAERRRQEWEMSLAQAWYGAAIARQKRLTPLKNLLHPPQTRALTAEERAQRQAEFEELKERMRIATRK